MKTTLRPAFILLALAVSAPLPAADLPRPPPMLAPSGVAPNPSANAAAPAGSASAVLSPSSRASSLEAAKMLLAGTTYPVNPAQVDPFNPPAFAGFIAGPQPVPGPGTPPPAGPVPGADLLRKIAAGLKPSGHFVIGGEPTLVFGQKRVKAGSTMTINFEGSAYTVEIAAVTNTTFTLRLNREEYTRPIK